MRRYIIGILTGLAIACILLDIVSWVRGVEVMPKVMPNSWLHQITGDFMALCAVRYVATWELWECPK